MDLKKSSEHLPTLVIWTGIDVHFLSKMKYAKINSSVNGNLRKGVLFSTYSSLIGESQGGGKYKSRYGYWFLEGGVFFNLLEFVPSMKIQ